MKKGEVEEAIFGRDKVGSGGEEKCDGAQEGHGASG